MKKRLSILFIFMLLFQTMSSSLLSPSQAEAEGLDQNIFIGTSYTDENGKDVNVDEIEDGAAVNVQFDWSVAHVDVEEVSTDSLLIPEELHISEEQKGTLTYTDETEVGTYQADLDDAVTIDLNEAIVENPEAEGSFVVEAFVVGEDEAQQDETAENDLDTERETEIVEEEVVVEEEPEEVEETEVTEQKIGTVEATEEKNEKSNSTFAAVDESLLSSFEFVIISGTNEIVVEDGADIEVDLDDMNAARLIYGITKPDGITIDKGDTYTIDLPSFFETSVKNNPINVDDIEVAKYSIVDGQVIITFNENVNDFDDVEMNVNLTGNFNTEVFETEQEVVVEVPFRADSSYTATLIAEQQDYDGEDRKTAGSPYIMEDGQKIKVDRNPEFIDWTVRANDSMDNLENATVVDDLGENLVIEEESFIVERIVRNYKNEEIYREPVEFTLEITDSGFELNLGDIKDAYDITYTTSTERPDGGGTHKINNNAKIILDGNETEVSDDFEGTWSGDIPAITKNGSLSDDREDVIDWTVEYNYGQENLGMITLNDELSHGAVLEDTVEVYQVNVDIDGNVIGDPELSGVSPAIDDEGNMSLELDADGKAYYITFSSSVPTGLNDDTVVNTISDDMPNPNTDDASVDVNTIPTGGKVGEQYVDEEGNPYIEWTITMNSEKIDVGTIDIIDVFNPDYLDFDVDDNSLFELMRDGEEVDNFNIEGYEHDDGREGFELSVNDAGPHNYEFVYRTYYTTAGMQEPELANNAELIFEDGDGVGIGEIDIDIDLTGPNSGIEKYGLYVSNEDNTQQEIKWTVTFNSSRILLDEGSTLTDTFKSENYEYVADSMEVVTGTESELNYTHDENDNGFVITLGEATNETVTVTYRTTTDDTDNLEHINDAVLDWQGGEEKESATVDIRNPGINKSGEVVINDDGSKTIRWTVDFNTNSNVLHDVVISDNLQPENLTINDNDIEISRDGEPLGEEAYTVDNPGQDGETFTIEMDRLDAVSYQLTYSSTLSPEQEVEDVNNTVDISYTGGEEDDKSNIPSPELGVQKEAIKLNKEPENREITWEINANTDSDNNYVNLVSPVLSDKIPEDQRLLGDTISVVRTDGVEINIDEDEINYDDNSFSINLPNGPYQYTVTFDTEILEYPSFHETDLDRYTNSTTLLDDHHGEVSDDAYQDYFDGGESGLVGKSGGQNSETEDIDWTMSVNEEGLTINNPEISDSLSDNQTYVEDSITVKNGSDNELDSDAYELNVAEDNRSFVITFTDNVITEEVNISYSTRLDPELIGTYNVTNSVSLSGGKEQREIYTSTTESTAQQWTYGGGGSGRTLEFTLEKLHENQETPIPGATFEFTRHTTDGTEIPIDNHITTGNDGEFLIDGARAGRYTVRETDVPEGYQQLTEPFHVLIGYATPEEQEESGSEYKVTVTDSSWNPISSEVASADGNTLTVYNGVETGEVTATKEWVNAEDSFYPETWFMLYRSVGDSEPEPVEGAEIKEINSDASIQEVTWEDIEMYAPNAEEYTFYVEEVDSEGNDFTPTGFTKEEEGLTVTNTASLTDVIVSKQWDDAENQDGIREDNVSVLLTADGTPVGEAIKLNESNNWSHTFEDLREYSGGDLINYSVEEVNVPEGYEANVEVEDGDIVVTNTHEPETVEVSVSKNWDDAEDQDGLRPDSVSVQLYAGEAEEGSPVTLSNNNGWSNTWNNLPEYANGEQISYTVKELNVPEDYEVVVDNENLGDIVVTNIHKPSKIDVKVTKRWDDAENQDDIRPGSVRVQLYTGEDEIGAPVTLNENTNWSNTWSDLPEYANGELIAYTVEELDKPESYEVVVNDENPENIVVTNSYTPETTEVTGTKTWDDAYNQDGIRPDSITVNLLANGQQVDAVEVTEEDGWSYDFTDLPKYEAGEEITYTVTEDTVADYTPTIDGFDITNKYTPGQTAVTVTKSWDDANNQDNIRPENIEVQLTADGESQGESVTLSEANNWTHTWTGLDEKLAGETIDYSVVELTGVPEYEPTVDDTDHGNIIITNAYTPETTEVTGTKTWDDADNEDNTRPESITVNLLANGEVVDSINVTEADDWNYSFTNLPKYEAGNEIKYTVSENAVENYESTVDGYDITNTLIPEEEETPPASTDSDKGNKGESLPETATNHYNMLMIGIALLAIGITIMIIYRKRKAA